MTKTFFLRALVTGALLGVVCIVGASLRSNEPLALSYLFAFWYNRVLMGAFIGIVPLPKKNAHALLMGAAIGLFISFAFYSATNFHDLIGFIVGIPYGLIIVVAMQPRRYQIQSPGLK